MTSLNPYNAIATIRYELPIRSRVTIDICDILGRKVTTLINLKQPAGYHQAIWQADDFSSGMYFYKFQAGDYTETKKMLLLK
ncbi:MAG: T9SS type A sorting domain-containing protein [candidate division Zixibacteria bacterium]|nr:T9SS type A sorting domain-containing protein [candidate division Zixibacteria bacterium]